MWFMPSLLAFDTLNTTMFFFRKLENQLKKFGEQFAAGASDATGCGPELGQVQPVQNREICWHDACSCRYQWFPGSQGHLEQGLLERLKGSEPWYKEDMGACRMLDDARRTESLYIYIYYIIHILFHRINMLNLYLSFIYMLHWDQWVQYGVSLAIS